jgi:hypothetical protein
MIRSCRAIASTFIGSPPTKLHTADHDDRNTENDTLHNIRWLNKPEQTINRTFPTTFKSAFIIVKNNIEMTANDWVKQLKSDANSFGREYTNQKILSYAQKKQHGFSYKKYPDLQEELWKEITGSSTKRGRWEISNMNRVKYITKYAENVLSGDRLHLANDTYPSIRVSGKNVCCHVIAFKTFFPEEYASKKPGEMVLHTDDDKMDFRPHKLRIGTAPMNGIDAHDNGSYDGKKTSRVKCSSYINDVFEKEYVSQIDAARYLKSIGYDRVSRGSIIYALQEYQNGKVVVRYGRTWR